MLTRRLRGLLALATIVALTLGVPWALSATVGNPLNHLSGIRAGDMSDTDVIAIIAGIIYLVWATFILALLIEVPTQLGNLLRRRQRRPARVVRVPLLGWQQGLARALVTSVLLILPVALSTFGPATAAMARPPVAATAVVAQQHAAAASAATIDQVAEHRSVAAAEQVAPARSYLVPEHGGLTTYWQLAAHYLGSGTEWRQVATLNEGRVQPDGQVMTSSGPLRPGWTVLLPAHATPDNPPVAGPSSDQEHPAATFEEVTVRLGDTLSGIAAEHGIEDWHEVWLENQDRAEPGGRHFTDPNLILPGWTVDVSGPTQRANPVAASDQTTPGSGTHVGDEAHVGETAHPTAESRTVAPSQTPPSTHVVPLPAASPTHTARHADGAPTRLHAVPAPDEQPTAAAEAPPLDAEPPVNSHELGTGVQAAAAAAAVTDPAVPPTASTHGNSAVVTAAEWTLSIGSGAGLLAGMLYTAMRLARRRRLRHRRPGRYLAPTAVEHAPLEQTLLTDGAAAQRDVVFIDHALRSLATDLAAADGRLPAIVAARLTADSLDLVLAGPQLEVPPAPWVAVSPTSWAIAKTADLPSLGELRATQAAPYPTLVSVGCTPAGEEWLVDLEQAGALAFDGDPERCLDLVRFIVAELAYNPWSDPLLVTVAGFGADLVALNPERLVHTDDVTAAATVAGRAIETNRDVADSHRIDVLYGRLHGISGDAWMPQVLVVAPDWDQDDTDAAAVDQLLATAGQRASRSAVVVVLAGDRAAGSPAGLRLTVHPNGTLLIPDLDVTGTASQLPAQQAVALADYLTAARTGPVDVPFPASQRTTGSAAFADTAGALRPEFKTAQHTATGAVIDLTTATTLPVGAQRTPVTAEPVAPDAEQMVPPTVAPEVTAAVLASDPTLDGDLADWHDPDCPRPKFDALGPVQIHATGPMPTNKLPLTIEAMFYLLLHPNGVTGDRFANDLWPKMNYTYAGNSNPRGVMTAARHWAGADPVTGQEYLVRAAASKAVSGVGLYRFVGALDNTDLFTRLRTRGEARGEQGREDLMAALRLVTGVPLSGFRPLVGAWLGERLSTDGLTAAIVDVADEVAAAALAAGDVAQAREAAQIALLTETADDRPLLALAACLDREGRQAELGATVRRIMTHHDEVLDTEPPDATIEIMRRNGWLERLSAG